MIRSMTKACSRCKKIFSISQFFKNCLAKDGLTPECKKCNYKKCKKWRLANREHANATARKLNAKYRKEGDLIEKNRKWKADHPEQVKKRRYEWYYSLKKEVFSYYSNGDPRCTCCKETFLEFLALDHIDGNGRKHRLSIAKERGWKTNSKGIGGGIATWRWAKRNNYPPIFQVLCHNCNMGKRRNSICPHARKAVN